MENSTRNRRLSQVVVNHIRNGILQGDLEDGARLPSERSLVEEMGLSRSSVREALRTLEALRLIRVLPREGAYVEASAEIRAAVSVCIEWLIENRDAIIEILDTREALDEKAAELAAKLEGESPGTVNGIEKWIVKMEEAIEAEDLAAVVEADVNFHLAIARSSRNEVLTHLAEILVSVFGESRRMLFALPGRAVKSLGEHRRIYQALQSCDPTLARRSVREHTESVKISCERIAEQAK